jgi:hypothetical protein
MEHIQLEHSKRIHEADQIQKRIREREVSDLRKVLSLPEGRRLVWRLMAASKLFQSTYTGQSNETFFNEGKRAIGTLIFADIQEAKLEAFQVMQREAMSDPLAHALANLERGNS